MSSRLLQPGHLLVVVVIPPLWLPLLLLTVDVVAIVIITVMAKMLAVTEVAEALAKAGSENDRAYRSVPSVENQRGRSKTVTILVARERDATHNVFRSRNLNSM
ncbi:hypothetical protein EDB85DRAFT_1888173 [Lactarius pseudohatsudake]|nr:hypothetical protein EDB85DRAFT_1888173 [Lactarius pseudohatsudake]